MTPRAMALARSGAGLPSMVMSATLAWRRTRPIRKRPSTVGRPAAIHADCHSDATAPEADVRREVMRVPSRSYSAVQ